MTVTIQFQQFVTALQGAVASVTLPSAGREPYPYMGRIFDMNAGCPLEYRNYDTGEFFAVRIPPDADGCVLRNALQRHGAREKALFLWANKYGI